MLKDEVRARIEEIGIIPAIRVSATDDALFAAEAVCSNGIPIVEVTMTVPGALDVVRKLVEKTPAVIVGAGTILSAELAQQCVDVGARFLTSPGLDPAIVEVAHQHGVLALPGALTPTEVLSAWRAGGDMVKVYPCAQVGGATYIRALRGPFPNVRLIASGGVTQQTASDFILAGANALGIGGDLIPRDAIRKRDAHWIGELAHRFLGLVKEARKRLNRGRS